MVLVKICRTRKWITRDRNDSPGNVTFFAAIAFGCSKWMPAKAEFSLWSVALAMKALGLSKTDKKCKKMVALTCRADSMTTQSDPVGSCWHNWGLNCTLFGLISFDGCFIPRHNWLLMTMTSATQNTRENCVTRQCHHAGDEGTPPWEKSRENAQLGWKNHRMRAFGLACLASLTKNWRCDATCTEFAACPFGFLHALFGSKKLLLEPVTRSDISDA